MQGVSFHIATLSDFISYRKPNSVFVLLDSNTQIHCYPLLVSLLPSHETVIVKSGELHKNLQSCEFIWEKLSAAEADRNSLLINVGGGMITDLGGFAAACYKRGIGFVNVPTTLLAMVDAAIGAKTGIDFLGFKNQIGVFKQAELVVLDTIFLNTLAQRELLSGMAEVVKHYLIADKEAFFELSNSGNQLSKYDWTTIVKKNIAIKQSIVEKDPHEIGDRKALNFGHTIGHAVESFFMDKGAQSLLHGEAVAIGMVCEAYLSCAQSLLTNEELRSVTSLINKLFSLPALPHGSFPHLIELIKQDKKNISGIPRFTLLHGIGNYSIHQCVEQSIIIESFNYFNNSIHEQG